MKDYQYVSGHGNYISTEAVKGALPDFQNTPQQCPLGLYAEQLNGTSFTTPRVKNQKVWYYRIRPSVMHKPFSPLPSSFAPGLFCDFSSAESIIDPNQIRWRQLPVPLASVKKVNFVQGLVSFCGAGSPESKTGLAVHMYGFNTSMTDAAFCNADGDMLIVPQQGAIRVQSEHGWMLVKPVEVCVIPRGVRFAVFKENESDDDAVYRGYICEVYSGHFVIPDLGPIGANGLANTRDFVSPVAAFEERANINFRIIHKFGGRLFECVQAHTCFDVVAWHGNYAPYKYDLAKFIAVNSVTFDHLDPSIFTVLTCPSGEPGVATADFVIFPPRWTVTEKTFRPPYYHRNTMTEYMGLIVGAYEAKDGKGFVPGGGSLHSCMSAHGPEAAVFETASKADLKPHRVADGSMAFMFETTFIMRLSPYVMADASGLVDKEYFECWQGLKANFKA
eukprot:ANDGO_04040.mRNA.1 Homogentisate 1